MISPQLTLGLHDEIFVDNFAGGGGASTGIEQVRMCGNSVCPPLARALVAANLPELCREALAA